MVDTRVSSFPSIPYLGDSIISDGSFLISLSQACLPYAPFIGSIKRAELRAGVIAEHAVGLHMGKRFDIGPPGTGTPHG